MSKVPAELDPVLLESLLKGKTLIVYWYLLQQPSHTVGIREVQRSLGFSSPSIAVHHLEKRQDLGLVQKKVTGEYVLEEEVKVGILRFFTRMGSVRARFRKTRRRTEKSSSYQKLDRLPLVARQQQSMKPARGTLETEPRTRIAEPKYKNSVSVRCCLLIWVLGIKFCRSIDWKQDFGKYRSLSRNNKL